MWGSAIAALAALGALYWAGMVTEHVAGFVLVVLFPVYLLLAASVLSKWLGYDKDVSDLRPVSPEDEEYPESDRGPW
jgi:hypothetical protein